MRLNGRLGVGKRVTSLHSRYVKGRQQDLPTAVYPTRPFSTRSGHSADPLFDHPVGAQQDGLRDHDAEGLGDLEVDDQLELAGCWIGRSFGLAPFRTLST